MGKVPAGDFNEETLIEVIQRTGTEQLRISACSYKGHPYINIRVWAECNDGVFRPIGRKGVTVRVGEVGTVIAALAAAEAVILESRES
jgi:hypothetical protein